MGGRQAGVDAAHPAGRAGLVERVSGKKGRIAHHGEAESGVGAACMMDIFSAVHAAITQDA